MGIRTSLGTNITRVNRNGVDLIATPHLKLQLGDRVTVVGTELAIAHTEKLLGNQMKRLNAPNLIPIFLGIMLGCIVANIPFFLPGINESLRLGLTGGPLVVAILIGFFGPKYNLVTYNTISALPGHSPPGAEGSTTNPVCSENPECHDIQGSAGTHGSSSHERSHRFHYTQNTIVQNGWIH